MVCWESSLFSFSMLFTWCPIVHDWVITGLARILLGLSSHHACGLQGPFHRS